MKQTLKILTLCAALTAGTATVLCAQPPQETAGQTDSLHQRRPHRRMPQIDPEKEASREADRLKDSLQLDDKQYKKVYKLYLREFQSRQQSRPQGPRRGGMGGFGGMSPMGGGGMPPMMGGGEGFPDMSGETRRERPSREDMKAFMEERKKEAEERARKLDKKMTKILTDEQYAKWKSMKPGLPQRPDVPRPQEERSME